jgi:hypothetical protein
MESVNTPAHKDLGKEGVQKIFTDHIVEVL